MKKTRVQLDFSPIAMQRLEELKEKTEASSYAEVMKNALKLYTGLIEEAEKGNIFYTRDKNGNMTYFKMFL